MQERGSCVLIPFRGKDGAVKETRDLLNSAVLPSLLALPTEMSKMIKHCIS